MHPKPKIGQRWMWHDLYDSKEELAIAEVIGASPGMVRVVQIIKGNDLSGFRLGNTLRPSWDWKGFEGKGGWTYLEGQDKPK